MNILHFTEIIIEQMHYSVAIFTSKEICWVKDVLFKKKDNCRWMVSCSDPFDLKFYKLNGGFSAVFRELMDVIPKTHKKQK